MAEEGPCRDQALPRALRTLEDDGGIMKQHCGEDEQLCSDAGGPRDSARLLGLWLSHREADPVPWIPGPVRS